MIRIQQNYSDPAKWSGSIKIIRIPQNDPDPAKLFGSREMIRIQQNYSDPAKWSGSIKIIRIPQNDPDPAKLFGSRKMIRIQQNYSDPAKWSGSWIHIRCCVSPGPITALIPNHTAIKMFVWHQQWPYQITVLYIGCTVYQGGQHTIVLYDKRWPHIGVLLRGTQML